MEVVNCTKYLTACEKTVNGKAVTVTHYEKSSIFIYVSMEYGKIQHLEMFSDPFINMKTLIDLRFLLTNKVQK